MIDQLIQYELILKIISNYLLICSLSFFFGKKKSLPLYDSKLNIFGLQTKQDMRGHHFGALETHFIEKTAHQSIEKIIKKLIDN